jgi:diguanylate cyclase (GGDEF)-like protein/PAS domain S-box-containing protein
MTRHGYGETPVGPPVAPARRSRPQVGNNGAHQPAAAANAEGDVATLSRLKEIVRLAPIGIGIVEADGTSRLTNDALSAMLGYTPEEFAQLPFEAFTHPEDIRRNLDLFGEMMAGERDGFEMDKRFLHKEGHIVWGRLLVSLLDDGDGPMAIGLLQDITEEKRLREELERLAFRDPLTELANRRLFTDRVEHHLQRGRRNEAELGALLFADLDDFKTLNDTLGHQAGDDVLRAVAQRITSCLRPSDTASRLGGDEFAVLLEEAGDVEVVWAIAERVRARIIEPIRIVDRMVTPGVSLGFTLLTREHDTDRALSEADLAMYRAKASDEGIANFTTDLFEAVVRRFEERAEGQRSAAPAGPPNADGPGTPWEDEPGNWSGDTSDAHSEGAHRPAAFADRGD